jgi:soluble lytic murein transglycosylase-like protein
VIVPVLLAGAALVGVTSSAPSAVAPCDRRADVEAVRNADGAVRAALRKRFDDEVAAATDPRARGCAAAVAAEAAALDGDKARTLALLDVVVAGVPAVAGDVRPHRALLLAELGRVDDARRELALLAPQDVGWRARVELGLADAKKDHESAKAILRRLGARDAAALGRLCTDYGDEGACVDVLLRHPRSDIVRKLEQWRDDGTEVAVLRVEGWPAARMTARLRALTGAARPHRAVLEGRAWNNAHRLTAAGDGSMAVAAALGEALLRTGDVAAAVDITAGFESRGDVDRGRALVAFDFDAAKVHAKALSRAGRVDEAIAAWRSVVDAAGWQGLQGRDGSDVAAEAAFFVGFTLVEADRVDEALVALAAARAHTTAAPTKTWETQRAWYEALLWLTARRDHARALPILDELSGGADREARKFQFWRARALAAAGQDERARSALRALVAADPLDWYGLLARRDLGLPPIAGARIPPDALVQLAAQAADDDDAAAARLLFSLGFDDEARDRCRRRLQARPGRPTLADVGVCHGVDDPTTGWRRGALFTPTSPGAVLPPSSAWRASYAAPWTAAVDDIARVARVPRSFVWAIMRTESGFDPAAVSVAGARGALQLLPSVAGGIARHAGLDPALAQRLHEPGVAIALGGRLLGLLAAEHGSLLVAAAAYNGAPENAAAWAARFGALPPEVFVERITFKEARDYVKRVLAVEAVYRGLDGQPVALDLPTTITPAKAPTLFPYTE